MQQILKLPHITSLTNPIHRYLSKDPRHYQILFQLLFLIYGITILDWDKDIFKYACIFASCISLQWLLNKTEQKETSIKSALISALSLCLILKTNSITAAVIAALLSISSKYIFRINGKHIFNPTNFGIIATILLTKEAWITPGQWGSNGMLLFIIGSLGFSVLLTVKRLDIALTFLITFCGLNYLRQVIYLGWETDFFFHTFTSGTVLLFTFFMITDPVSTPSSKKARIIWAILTGALAYWLQTKLFVTGAPVWALFFLSPLTPLFDYIFKGERFQWTKNNIYQMKPIAKISLLVLIFSTAHHSSDAFCGFYVAKADAGLFNKASQVIMVRDGDRTVITMSSDFKGAVRDFAMVVPVPVVLQEKDIRIAERVLFDKLDAYSGPRLVEYQDQNPCYQYMYDSQPMSVAKAERSANGAADADREDEKFSVKIEAKYTVGEYDILILSAKESGGLEAWLLQSGYKVPAGAREVLEPYIKSNMKFFVVKVNLEEQSKTGSSLLRPIQVTFNSPKFMLPIRLGMANAKDEQDLIVYALTRNGRVETTNYRTVKIPTDKKIPEFVEDVFGKFYVDVFKRNRNKEGKNNVYLEYAWNISGSNGVKCDPCPSPPPIMADLAEAGVNWLRQNSWNGYDGNVYFTRLHVTYDRENFPQDLVFQETLNSENFQGRYIITHPAQGDFTCERGQQYRLELKERRGKELQQLASLTGWDVSYYREYIYDLYDYQLPSQPVMKKVISQPQIKKDTTGFIQPGEIPSSTEKDFQPVYAKTENEKSTDFATPVFMLLSLVMLIGVMKGKG